MNWLAATPTKRTLTSCASCGRLSGLPAIVECDGVLVQIEPAACVESNRGLQAVHVISPQRKLALITSAFNAPLGRRR